MKKWRRYLAGMLALAVVFILLFDLCFTVTQADHDCAGEDCPICCQINICENTLRSAGFVAAAVIFAGILGLFAVTMPAFAKKQACTISLVSLKVKLSD